MAGLAVQGQHGDHPAVLVACGRWCVLKGADTACVLLPVCEPAVLRHSRLAEWPDEERGPLNPPAPLPTATLLSQRIFLSVPHFPLLLLNICVLQNLFVDPV